MEQIDVVKTMKLHIRPSEEAAGLFRELTERYRDACNCVSDYIFEHGFELRYQKVQEEIYYYIREKYDLKAQMTISTLKTTTAMYKTIQEQLQRKPFRYKDENDKWQSVPRTLEWLKKPVHFQRPQADLVRNRDYSFVNDGKELSINTLGKRVNVAFDVPECFREYFDGSWSFGTGKLVFMLGEWYFHIPMTRKQDNTFNRTTPTHVVGIDRGLRFVMNTYDETGHSEFFSGRAIMQKRQTFKDVRAELQSKGTKSAKRRLKALSGRENRWMTDVNHQLSKALVHQYGPDTLFVIEDLTGVSFSEENLSSRRKDQRGELRSWAFYQLEQMLTYKAAEIGSFVLKVPAAYTSQRCPKCGRIRKENRNHKTHEYVCDCCRYRSNDDRIGAMNLHDLGQMYVKGDDDPRIVKPAAQP